MGLLSARRAWISLITIPLALAVGCATSGETIKLEPRIEITQLPGSEFLVTRGRAVSVAYQMSVENTTAGPITLRRVELTTSPRSPYEIENAEPLAFDVVIERGAKENLTFDTWVVPRARKADSLVYLTGTAHFESASGSFEVRFRSTFRVPA